jgi:8-oxo-dGTP pyrophosphatase MutT (NUDIX family)
VGKGILKRYVVGFVFTRDREKVVLIKKERSRSGFEWMIGKCNGLGGKIDNEGPFQAMSREFLEESNVFIAPYEWEWCGKFGRYVEYEVIVFRAFIDEYRLKLTASEEGSIHLVNLADISNVDTVKNLSWLIPLCLKEDLKIFHVEE